MGGAKVMRNTAAGNKGDSAADILGSAGLAGQELIARQGGLDIHGDKINQLPLNKIVDYLGTAAVGIKLDGKAHLLEVPAEPWKGLLQGGLTAADYNTAQ